MRPPIRRQRGRTLMRLNVCKSQDPETDENLQNALKDKFSGPCSSQSLSIEEEWTSFRDTVHSTSPEVLGTAQKKNQDWFDENDSFMKVLVKKKNHLFSELQSSPSSQPKRNAFNQDKQKKNRNSKTLVRQKSR